MWVGSAWTPSIEDDAEAEGSDGAYRPVGQDARLGSGKLPGQ